MTKTPEQVIINNDIMRYKKNKLPASLALLALVFNCLYFCLLYSFTGTYFSKWEIGISVIVSLLTLLLTFLSSEGIKGYNKKYCILMLIIAAVQIIRIFGLPLEALKYNQANDASVFQGAYFDKSMPEMLSFTFLVIWLVASASCLVAASVTGYINCTRLERYTKQVANGEVNVDEVLKKLDETDSANAVHVVSDPEIDGALKAVEAEEEASDEALAAKEEKTDGEEALPVNNGEVE